MRARVVRAAVAVPFADGLRIPFTSTSSTTVDR
jgi:hypothetical protein